MLPLNTTNKIASLAVLSTVLVACEKPITQNPIQSSQQTASSSAVISVASTADDAQGNLKKIDWQKIASGEKAIDPKNFKYPFELGSEVVKMYAKEYNIDNESARYQMTVGMVINEVLLKLLDELGTSYASHEIVIDKTDKRPILKVHTTADVANFSADYVFSDKFAKGLSIKVQLINDGVKKPIQNPHSDE